jgi:hypothetical protein
MRQFVTLTLPRGSLSMAFARGDLYNLLNLSMLFEARAREIQYSQIDSGSGAAIGRNACP